MFTAEELKQLNPKRIPLHVAMIPDGNRRWAKGQALNVLKGHEQGADVLMDTLRAAKSIGIKAMTFYTFSTENWSRPKFEVAGLLALIENYLKNKLPTMLSEGVRFHTLGNLAVLPQSLQGVVALAKRETAHLDQIDLILALNYGARDEMIRACRKIAHAVACGQIKEEQITEPYFTTMLDTAPWPDPDLLIRTSGEARLSNFLLWQLSYAEICLVPVLWPDFKPRHLLEAILEFQKRERRCGGD